MDKISSYVKESYYELVNKVTWPSWASLLESTRVVLVAALIFSIIVFAMDMIAKFFTGIVYDL